MAARRMIADWSVLLLFSGIPLVGLDSLTMQGSIMDTLFAVAVPPLCDLNWDLLGPNTAPLMLGVMMIVLAAMLLRSQRVMARRRTEMPSYELPPRQEQESEPHHLGAPRSMVQWEVQMHDTARELSGRLDSKMSVLEHLIREADRAAARLETALANLQAAGGGDASVSAASQPAAPSPPSQPSPSSLPSPFALPPLSPQSTDALETPSLASSSSADEPADAGVSATDGATSAPAIDEAAATPPPNQADGLATLSATEHARGPRTSRRLEDVDARPPADQRYQEIYTLADYGYSPDEISHRMGMPIGEVQLVLGLRRTRS